MRKVFERMEIGTIKPVLTEWGSLIPGLRAGRFDLIAAGMYITPERCKQVLFTDPHYRLLDTLLVAQGNPKELRSYEDIAGNPEVKIAIMSGTVNLGYARKAGIKDSQILQVPDTTSQLQAVRSGRADAAIGTQLTMRGLAAKASNDVEAIADFEDDPARAGYGALAPPAGRSPARCSECRAQAVAGQRGASESRGTVRLRPLQPDRQDRRRALRRLKPVGRPVCCADPPPACER